MGCFTLPDEGSVQQLEGNVHRDEINSGTYYHIPLNTFGTIIFLTCVVTFISQFSQVEFRHFNKNSCDLEFCVKTKDFPMQFLQFVDLSC